MEIFKYGKIKYMKKSLIRIFIVGLLVLIYLSVNPVKHIFAKDEESYLVPYIGMFDIFDKKHYTLGGLELRTSKLIPNNYFIVTKIGAYFNKKNSVYGYLGFNLDIPLYKDFYVAPGFALGAYSKGKGKKLGGTLEFRSSIELGYKMINKHKVGISLSHISNANIYKKNPGAEDLVITYSIPF